jgi:hypothetical protein
LSLPGLNWTADLDALCGVQITEVDMHDAGMSIVRADKLLDGPTIKVLEAMPKSARSVEVGKISRERSKKKAAGPSLSDLITKGIQRRVEEMLDRNGIGSDRILSVKRDAVFVTGPPPGALVLPDGTRFRAKGSYTSFARLGQVELYCVPKRGTWDLKGVAEERRHLHTEVIGFVLDVLRIAEFGDAVEAADTVRQFRQDYVRRLLPPAFYRELNAASSFSLRAGGMKFLLDGLGVNFPLGELDISYNVQNVIIPLARALT